MNLIRNEETENAIKVIASQYVLSTDEQKYIGNPIDLYGVCGLDDKAVNLMIEETKQKIFGNKVPEWFDEKKVPASIFATIYFPVFIQNCYSKLGGCAIAEDVMRSSIYLSADEMMNDPYMKNISVPEVRNGAFCLRKSALTKYDLFVLDNKQADDPYSLINIPVVACMDKDYDYPLLEENGQVWMSIAPNELVTMKDDLDAAEGNVLTFGLGLGYYPYLASLKDNVSHVTVVEKNKSVISLFEKYLLPQMETKDKITIVRDNAFTYLRNLKDGEFDCCFADIWVDSDDVDTYLKMKSASFAFEKTRFSFWLESRFIAIISLIMMQIIMNSYYGGPQSYLDSVRRGYPQAFKVANKILEHRPAAAGNELIDLLRQETILSELREIERN
ncbi:MAG: hypothetical protein IJI14_09810 [Anaerolineaceae bacterium]|nr:hypothetical protein [Anaerolineaceae bacterium]